jgi:hypothetical protein
MMHTTACHVIITARAKMVYDVSDSGEPTEAGLRPDAEKGVPFAMDLVVLTHVRDKVENDLKPGDFMATVVGTRSPSVGGSVPEIPIGRTFYDPKFSDFLEAMVKGTQPVAIEDTLDQQVAAGKSIPQNWADFEAWLKHSTNWDLEDAKGALRKNFGEKLTGSHLEEYYDFLRTRQPYPDESISGGEAADDA